MAQKPQIVDLRKSFYPGDPEVMPRNLVNTNKEDGEENILPIIAYEGYNFLPTSYGYRSYFGLNSDINISTLNSNVQEILTYNTIGLKFKFIALCDDGIWVGDTIDNAWVQLASLSPTEKLWTHCIIENVLYMYRAGESLVYTYSGLPAEISNVIIPSTSTTITGVLYYTDALLPVMDVNKARSYWIAPLASNGALGPISAESSHVPLASVVNKIKIQFSEVANASAYRLYYQDGDDTSNIFYLDFVYDTINEGLLLTGNHIFLGLLPHITPIADVASWEKSFPSDIIISTPTVGVLTTGAYSFNGLYNVYVSYISDGATDYITSPKLIGSFTYTGGSTPDINVSMVKSSRASDTLLFYIEDTTNNYIFTYKYILIDAEITINIAEASTELYNSYKEIPLAPPRKELESFTPTFLTMSGQRGVFKAGTRLGFWDSMNSVSWSSNLDITDFTPSLENLANNALFADVIGSIVFIKEHGEGFIIYSTKSIIGVSPSMANNFLWDAKDVMSSIGICHPLSIVRSYNESEHFAVVTNGIIRIGKFNALAGKYETEYLFPEVYDFLRESRDPIFLKMLNQRYLCLEIFNDAYISYSANTFTKPSDNYLLQVGSLGSFYTERKGMLVFDLHLKKWGKMKQNYQVLVDYQAANIPAYSQFTHTDLGITAGVLKSGTLYNWDSIPADSYMKFGKIGYYRLGVIHFLETRLDFRRFATGTVTIEASLDGRNIDHAIDLVVPFTSLKSVLIHPNFRYRWYNIKLEGNWDLQYLEVRANFSGRR